MNSLMGELLCCRSASGVRVFVSVCVHVLMQVYGSQAVCRSDSCPWCHLAVWSKHVVEQRLFSSLSWCVVSSEVRDKSSVRRTGKETERVYWSAVC